MGVEKGDDETLGVPAEREERLQLGDRGVVSTSAKPLMQIVLARKTRKSGYCDKEYMHFKAQMKVEQVLTRRTVEGTDLVNKDEGFSLMELVFVPLQPQKPNNIERMNEAHVRWQQFNTFSFQYRPLTIGVQQQKECELQQQ